MALPSSGIALRSGTVLLSKILSAKQLDGRPRKILELTCQTIDDSFKDKEKCGSKDLNDLLVALELVVHRHERSIRDTESTALSILKCLNAVLGRCVELEDGPCAFWVCFFLNLLNQFVSHQIVEQSLQCLLKIINVDNPDLWIRLLPGTASALVRFLATSNPRVRCSHLDMAADALNRLIIVYKNAGQPEQLSEPFGELLERLSSLPTRQARIVAENAGGLTGRCGLAVTSVAMSFGDHKTTELIAKNVQSTELVTFMKRQISLAVNAPEVSLARISETVHLLSTRNELSLLSNVLLQSVADGLTRLTYLLPSDERVQTEGELQIERSLCVLFGSLNSCILNGMASRLMSRLQERRFHAQSLYLLQLLAKSGQLWEYDWSRSIVDEVHSILETMLTVQASPVESLEKLQVDSIVLSLRLLAAFPHHHESTSSFYVLAAASYPDGTVASEAASAMQIDDQSAFSAFDHVLIRLRSPCPSVLCLRCLRSIINATMGCKRSQLVKRLTLIFDSKELDLALAGALPLENKVQFQTELLTTINAFLSGLKQCTREEVEPVQKACDMLRKALYDKRLQLEASQAITVGFRLLAPYSDSFLPLVHRCWPAIKHANVESADLILRVLCTLCPDFVQQRVCEFLRQEKAGETDDEWNVTRGNWLRLSLGLIPLLCMEYQLAEDIINQSLEYCSAIRCIFYQQKQLRDGILLVFQELGSNVSYSALLWYIIKARIFDSSLALVYRRPKLQFSEQVTKTLSDIVSAIEALD